MIEFAKRSFRRWRNRPRWRRPLTLKGRFFLIATVVCGHALIDPTIGPILAFVVSILVVSLIASLFYRPRILIQAQEPAIVCLGETIEFRVTLTNLRHHPAYDLDVDCINVPGGWRMLDNQRIVSSLEPGQSRTLCFNVASVLRGVFELPRVRVTSSFPFGLFRQTSASRIAGTSVIAPACNVRRFQLDQEAQGADFQDLQGGRHVNSSLEYIGSREYQSGVPVRRWDFVSWARIGVPTVCEYVEGTHRSACIVVDLELTNADHLSGHGEYVRFEALLSEAASLVHALMELKYECQMLLVGKSIETVLADTNQSARDEMLEALARCAPAESVDWQNMQMQRANFSAVQADVFAILGQREPELHRDEALALLTSSGNPLRFEIVGDDFLDKTIDSTGAAELLDSGASS